MTDAKSYTRPATGRRARLFKVGDARSALRDLDRGTELTCYTFGQFSIVDVLVALLERTGPADVDIATWTAGAADLRRAAELMRDDRIRSCRWVVDHSFRNRQPEYLALMQDLFGADSVRPLRTHAKFLTIRGGGWHLVVRTSMNLNENKRLENFDVIDDVDFYTWHRDMVDGIFADGDGSDWVDHDDLDLSGVAATDPEGQIDVGVATFGRIFDKGVASVGTD